MSLYFTFLLFFRIALADSFLKFLALNLCFGKCKLSLEARKLANEKFTLLRVLLARSTLVMQCLIVENFFGAKQIECLNIAINFILTLLFNTISGCCESCYITSKLFFDRYLFIFCSESVTCL